MDLFYPSEVEGMLNLEINGKFSSSDDLWKPIFLKKIDLGDSLKVYAQNELDHVYILDRQTAYLWKVEPETCAITKFSLQ